jgi:uncharacterized protein YbaR (Trm112 family)
METFHLSNPDSLDRDSPYLAARNNRFKINNLVGFGQIEKKNQWCIPCYSSGLGRLISSPKEGEEDMLYCRNCGKSYSIDDINKTKPTQNLAKPQQTSRPILISQKSKAAKPRKQVGSVNDELTDEDIGDLRSSGIEPS